ncbi:cupin domain-containing protein [Pelagibius sp. Alg239-R121]|uniref:cupin domain-containing protein n=1 Tax=Pelagibius sp. Alg239-R121 TaxID=2993448 RepID=UPI0024A69E1A|nr:cupin domain-containing protein [Pelagibius sp. Alg239-R121]
MDPIETGKRRVKNFQTADFETLERLDGKTSGASILQLDSSAAPGVGFHLYRLEPGASSEPHEHSCNEQFVVLQGSLLDHDGIQYREGDFVWLEAGTRHSSYSPDGCLLAVYFETAAKTLA